MSYGTRFLSPETPQFLDTLKMIDDKAEYILAAGQVIHVDYRTAMGQFWLLVSRAQPRLDKQFASVDGACRIYYQRWTGEHKSTIGAFHAYADFRDRGRVNSVPVEFHGEVAI
jgi:hypothetical protein